MQAVSVLPFAEFSGKFEHEFAAKLRIYDENTKNENRESHEEEEGHEEHEEEGHEEEEGEEGEEEFTFVFANPDGSPVSADDIFDNGQIRPVFPIFDQNLLFSDNYDGGEILRPPVKKVFVQKQEESPSSSSSPVAEPEGPYCSWSPKTAVKSNSTGFSKIWKLRHDKLRSNSDGKDAFVFLSSPSSTVAVKAEKSSEKARSGEGNKVNGTVTKVNNNKVVKGKTTSSSSSSSSSSAHEKHYVMNRAKKESDKRKSYLPYRQELFGFFASSNGLSRNVHPY